MKTPILTNAQEMARQNPETFTIPDTQNLTVGCYVKVCVQFEDQGNLCQGERFWVKLTAVKGDILEGVIINKLIAPHLHGLNEGDEIKFHVINIYAIPAN
jgi:hypothetical protein